MPTILNRFQNFFSDPGSTVALLRAGIHFSVSCALEIWHVSLNLLFQAASVEHLGRTQNTQTNIFIFSKGLISFIQFIKQGEPIPVWCSISKQDT